MGKISDQIAANRETTGTTGATGANFTLIVNHCSLGEEVGDSELVKAYRNTQNNTIRVHCKKYKIYPDHSLRNVSSAGTTSLKVWVKP